MNNNNNSDEINLDNGLCKVGSTWFEHLGNNSQFNIKVHTAQLLYLYEMDSRFTFFANVLDKNNIFEAIHTFYPKNRK